MSSPRTSWRRFAVLAASIAALTAAAAAAPLDFTVDSPVDGRKFRLADVRGRYVALHFLLKTECPYCLRHTREYAKRSAASGDVTHIFLKPDSADEIKRWSSGLGADAPKGFTVYRDADAKLADAYGIPGGYAFHGETVHYPALVLLDPAGKEVFRHVGKDNSDRLGSDAFATKLAELKAAAGSNPKKP
jgi:peroxiredoxin Q/BCP